MKISEAKSRITRHRIFAAVIMITATLLLACAALKSIYFSVEGDRTALASLSQTLQRIVYFVYKRTQFVSWFWEWSPVIKSNELNTTGNWGFLFVVVCGAIGRTMWDSASNLSLRIKRTIHRVEELGWEQELMGHRGQIAGARPDVLQINIELDQKDQWYKRPIGLLLLGVAIAILGQWLNLQFGLVKL
ncbi:MAG: YniB family protein [Variovorax sp.]